MRMAIFFGFLMVPVCALSEKPTPIPVVDISDMVGLASEKPAPRTVADYLDLVHKKDSSFDDHVLYQSYGLDQGYLWNNQKVFLRSWRSKDFDVITHQLYVEIWYRGDWHHYQSASFDGGYRQDIISIGRKVVSCGQYYDGCSFKETVGLDMSDSLYVVYEKQTDITVRFNAQSGHEVFVTLPQEYIEAHFMAINTGR